MARISAEYPPQLRDDFKVEAAVEVASSMVLLVGAGLLIRSFVNLRAVDSGYQPERVLAMTIPLQTGQYDKAEDRMTFFRELLRRLQQIPGVQSASVSRGLPSRSKNLRLFAADDRVGKRQVTGDAEANLRAAGTGQCNAIDGDRTAHNGRPGFAGGTGAAGGAFSVSAAGSGRYDYDAGCGESVDGSATVRYGIVRGVRRRLAVAEPVGGEPSV
ncbi:MAG: hypothetical protein ABI693_19000 [Bryobacteraceae bacterium]